MLIQIHCINLLYDIDLNLIVFGGSGRYVCRGRMGSRERLLWGDSVGHRVRGTVSLGLGLRAISRSTGSGDVIAVLLVWILERFRGREVG